MFGDLDQEGAAPHTITPKGFCDRGPGSIRSVDPFYDSWKQIAVTAITQRSDPAELIPRFRIVVAPAGFLHDHTGKVLCGLMRQIDPVHFLTIPEQAELLRVVWHLATRSRTNNKPSQWELRGFANFRNQGS